MNARSNPDRLLRVVQVVNTLGVADGGPARNSFELNIALNSRIDTTAQLYWMRGSQAASVLVGHDYGLKRAPIPGPLRIALRGSIERRLASPIQLLRSLRESDVVIIHGYYLSWIPVMVSLLRIMRLSHVIAPHGALTSHQLGKSVFKKYWYEVLCGAFVRRGLCGFVTGSQVEANDIRARFPDSRTAVAGVGTRFPSVINRAESWGQPVKLLAVSRIARKKRLDLSIGATAELVRRGYDVELTIVGEGDTSLTSQLRDLAHRLQVQDRVHFVGQHTGSSKESFYLSADVFLMPSDDENFGIGLAEALAAGVPVVTTSAVAASGAMTSNCGKVLSAPSSTDLAVAIEEILTWPAKKTREDSRACAENNFGWAQASEKWVAALRNLDCA